MLNLNRSELLRQVDRKPTLVDRFFREHGTSLLSIRGIVLATMTLRLPPSLLAASLSAVVLGQTSPPPPGTTQTTQTTTATTSPAGQTTKKAEVTVIVKDEKDKPPSDKAEWITKDHTATIAGQEVKYQSTVGFIPIRNVRNEQLGKIFFTAYHRTNAPAGKRPLTFVFNGGPGSASLWLHLGFVGPKRVKMQPDGFMPAPPYELVPNDESLLPETDIVCIDPVGTGFSRPEKPENGKDFWGVQEDINSVGEFIRMYITLENRWLSPIFVLGESYGGIRGSGLANWLDNNGIGLNGLILVSPFINAAVQGNSKGNDSGFAFYFPTYAAAAWYHKKLDAAMEAKPVAQVFKEAQDWVYDDYMPSLLRGEMLKPEKRKAIIKQLHHFTGLSETYLDDTNLRIGEFDFFKELLRRDRYVVGRFDARFIGIDRVWNTQGPDGDPSDSQLNPPFISTMNDYLRNELGYVTSVKFLAGGDGLIDQWKGEDAGLDESEALRQAMHNNPYTKLFVAMGYYDLACPMGTVEQVLNQMELDKRLAGNISRGHYTAGHMMYLDTANRIKLHSDLAVFIKSATNPTAPDVFRRK